MDHEELNGYLHHLNDKVQQIFFDGAEMYRLIYEKLNKDYGSTYGMQTKYYGALHNRLDNIGHELVSINVDISQEKYTDLDDLASELEPFISEIEAIKQTIDRRSKLYLEEIYTLEECKDIIDELNAFKDKLSQASDFINESLDVISEND